MKRKRRTFALVAVVAATITGLGLRRPTARAQIDPLRQSIGLYEARQGSMGVLVGEVWREGTGASAYTEHWVLYPNYLNPNDTNHVGLSLRPGQTPYDDTRDFLQRVPGERGTRYVRVACADSDRRPSL